MMLISINSPENLMRRLRHLGMNLIIRKNCRNGLMIAKSTENKTNGGNKNDAEQKREDKIFCDSEADGTCYCGFGCYLLYHYRRWNSSIITDTNRNIHDIYKKTCNYKYILF